MIRSDAKEEYLDQVVVASLKPFLVCVIVVYTTFFAVRYYNSSEGWARDFSLPTLATEAIFFALLRVSLDRKWTSLRPGAVHAALTALVAAACACLHFALGLEVFFTNTLVLTVVAAGAFHLDRVWGAITVLGLVILWSGTIFLAEGHLLWEDLPPLVAAVLFAALLLHYRRSVFEKQRSIVESHREQNELLSESLLEARKAQELFEERAAQRASARAITLSQLRAEIEERTELEAMLRDAGEDNPLGRLASGVAHDFANLLTILRLNLEELSGMVHCPEAREILDDGLQETDEINTLVQQLLAYSRKQSLTRKVVQADDALTRFAEGLGGLLPENIEIKLSLRAENSPVVLDLSQFHQALLNLCLNASEAMPDGGNLKLSSYACDGQVFIEIRDSGEGMTEETLQQAREPYFTTKGFHAGRGLGLSVVEGILNQLNGTLSLRSSPGKGTTATVALPLFNQSALSPKKVLLVEDEDMARLVASRFLKQLGYEVLEADCAEKAKKLFFQQGSYPGLLVTDVVLPDENGISLATSLAQLCPGLKIIITSAHTQPALQEPQTNLEARFLPKPYGLSKLRELVEMVA